MAVKVDNQLTVANLSPTSRDLGKRMVQLAFTMGLSSSKTLEYLLNKTQLKNPGTTASTNQGAILYATFKSGMNVNLVAMANDFVPDLMRHANKEPSVVGNVLVGMIDQISRDRALRKK